MTKRGRRHLQVVRTDEPVGSDIADWAGMSDMVPPEEPPDEEEIEPDPADADEFGRW